MERRKVKSIFSDDFRKEMMRLGMNIRNDNNTMFFILLAGYMGFLVVTGFMIIPAQYGISQYAQYLTETYPGFPVSQSWIIMTYSLIFIVTKAFTILYSLVIGVYMLALGFTEEEASHKKQIARKPASANICTHCGNVHTRPIGKSYKGVEKRYCMSCGKFY